jgi:hypothetical protein
MYPQLQNIDLIITPRPHDKFQLLAAHQLGHLSIRLLWSQHFSIMFFQLIVLTFISQLYRSSIDQLKDKHWPIEGAASQTVTHPTMTYVLYFTRTCVRRVFYMINYMLFSMHLQLCNWKLSLQQGTRPYVSGFPLGCCDYCDHSTLFLIVITAG